jgi:hypothetical protein
MQALATSLVKGKAEVADASGLKDAKMDFQRYEVYVRNDIHT